MSHIQNLLKLMTMTIAALKTCLTGFFFLSNLVLTSSKLTGTPIIEIASHFGEPFSIF